MYGEKTLHFFALSQHGCHLEVFLSFDCYGQKRKVQVPYFPENRLQINIAYMFLRVSTR